MKRIFFCLFSLLLAAAPFMSLAETTNQWGDEVFGARLSITATNGFISPGTKIDLACVTRNFSTNTLCFVQGTWQGMYEIVLVDDAGNSIELNNPEVAGDSMEKMTGLNEGQFFKRIVPLVLDRKITAGHYRLVTKQKIFLIKNFDRKNMIQGELVSNFLDVQVGKSNPSD